MPETSVCRRYIICLFSRKYALFSVIMAVLSTLGLQNQYNKSLINPSFYSLIGITVQVISQKIVKEVFIKKLLVIVKGDNKELTTIGLFLKELRINSGYTQLELSHLSAVHLNSISRIENGNNFTIAMLLRLAEVLEITPAEVLSIIDE